MREEDKKQVQSLTFKGIDLFFYLPPKKITVATQNSASPIRNLKGNSTIKT
jgi:hypothetical protein